MDQGSVVFLINDESGNLISTLRQQDVPKKLPHCFQLKVLGKKKGAKPNLFLYTSEEMTPKNSTWLEDWKTFPLDKRHWEPKGYSIIKTLAAPVDVSKFTDIFNRERPSRKTRADCFLALSESDQAEFAKLSSRDQIKLLCVSKKMENQFMQPGFGLSQVRKYAEHIVTQKQRRERERTEKEAKEIATFRVEQRIKLALRDDHEDFLDGRDKDTGMLFTVGEGYSKEICRDRDMYFALGLTLLGFDLAEDQISQTLEICMQPKITASDQRRTKQVFDNLEKAWQQCLVNHDILHRIWFFYVLEYIKTERICGRHYSTASIIHGTWFRIQSLV